MLLGTHTPRLDDKGRLVLPAKFREDLAAGVVMTRGQERSVVVWPVAEFEIRAQRVTEASRTDPKVRAMQRMFFSGAVDEVPDAQGRVTVPRPLREYAGLDRDVVVVGNGSMCEIWDAAQWSSYVNESVDTYSDLSEEVVAGLF